MPQAASPGLTAEDVKAVRKNIDDFVRFMLARDFDTLARRYAEDAVMMPPNHAAVRGREAIRQYLSASYPVNRSSIVQDAPSSPPRAAFSHSASDGSRTRGPRADRHRQ